MKQQNIFVLVLILAIGVFLSIAVYYFLTPIATPFIPFPVGRMAGKTSCRVDDDCILINQERGFNCCYVSQCDSVDYSLSNWIAVNKDWFVNGKEKNCPSVVDGCGAAPMCVPVIVNDRFEAVCRSNKCEKTVKIVAGKCGIENCHGLNIACGPNVPVFCTLEYQLGDRCRYYASCKITNGICQLEESELFNSCKACVEKCLQDIGSDAIELSECENKCFE